MREALMKMTLTTEQAVRDFYLISHMWTHTLMKPDFDITYIRAGEEWVCTDCGIRDDISRPDSGNK